FDGAQDDRDLLHRDHLPHRQLVRVFGVELEEQLADQRIHCAMIWSMRASGESTRGSDSLARSRSGIARTSSGPWSIPVSISRSGMNSSLPLRPVVSFNR